MKNKAFRRPSFFIPHSPFFILFFALATNLPVSAQTVELNGVANVFGAKWACFSESANPGAPGFVLAEGESRFGVTFLSADLAQAKVQIEDHGRKFSLRLHANFGSGDLSQAPGENIAQANHPAANSAEKLDIGEQFQIMAGNPGWGTIPAVPPRNAVPGMAPSLIANSNPAPSDSPSAATPVAGGNSENANVAAAPAPPASSGATDTTGQTPNFPSLPAGGNPASSPAANNSGRATADPASQEWYQESLSIEQSRLENAADVLAGAATAWPRTPLTPPGTNPQLIGGETFFVSHIPGYMTPGFLNE